MTELSFFFDYSSPFAYLAATQVERVAAGATLLWRPFLLGGLFKAIGTPNVPLFEMPEAKRAHAYRDMQRWAEHYGVPLKFPTRFPMNTVAALRMTLELDNHVRGPLALRLFHAYWAEDRDIADETVLREIGDAVGFDGESLVRGTKRDDIKLLLRSETERAEKLGVCGAPCFLVKKDDEPEGVLFWGQDRLDFVDKALRGWRPANG
jgi:2-hydroxychromene-2-carboxylate isomerase